MATARQREPKGPRPVEVQLSPPAYAIRQQSRRLDGLAHGTCSSAWSAASVVVRTFVFAV